MDSGMQRLQWMMGEKSVPKKMLELNPKSALVQNLTSKIEADASNDVIDQLIEQLFESALLAEGLHPDPTEMLPRIEKLMEAVANSK